MRRIFGNLALGGACVLLLAAGANAQWRPYDNDDGYGRYDRGPRSYGYDPVNRTLNDLDRVFARSYTDNHERRHMENARRDLIRFQDRWARGRFDKDRLDSAIDNIHHLVNADQVDPRARQMLARDMDDLRAFRANRGYNAYRGDWRY